MTPVTEHPLRCETCNNITCMYHPIKFKGSHHPLSKDIPDHTFAYSITAEVGCASHSASSDKVSLTDEEFTHIIHSLETRPGTCWLCESIKKKIAELRQQKEREQR